MRTFVLLASLALVVGCNDDNNRLDNVEAQLRSDETLLGSATGANKTTLAACMAYSDGQFTAMSRSMQTEADRARAAEAQEAQARTDADATTLAAANAASKAYTDQIAAKMVSAPPRLEWNKQNLGTAIQGAPGGNTVLNPTIKAEIDISIRPAVFYELDACDDTGKLALQDTYYRPGKAYNSSWGTLLTSTGIVGGPFNYQSYKSGAGVCKSEVGTQYNPMVNFVDTKMPSLYHPYAEVVPVM